MYKRANNANNLLSDIFWEEPNVYKNTRLEVQKSHLIVP